MNHCFRLALLFVSGWIASCASETGFGDVRRDTGGDSRDTGAVDAARDTASDRPLDAAADRTGDIRADSAQDGTVFDGGVDGAIEDVPGGTDSSDTGSSCGSCGPGLVCCEATGACYDQIGRAHV